MLKQLERQFEEYWTILTDEDEFFISVLSFFSTYFIPSEEGLLEDEEDYLLYKTITGELTKDELETKERQLIDLEILKEDYNFDLVKTLRSMEQAAFNQLAFLQRAHTTVHFTLQNYNASTLAQLNNQTTVWELKNEFGLERCESINVFPLKINSILGILWTAINGLVGFSLFNVLESVSKLIA
ncbi:MAG: hypothetical protein GF308_19585 [Candidatus Heimdallarchaeota archaeon]|nr:hypothetical protein [Candidatus Heimdallarchaeota archaeon]